ncbi:uncharacterized protein [Procambarus clarkii]|uniref:uncharacterized protein n=1 Tax=Procambarus clarkii TaxID=6728 RepID=UPI0037449553
MHSPVSSLVVFISVQASSLPCCIMKLMASVLVTVVLTLLVAWTSTAAPGDFPFEKCFNETQKQDLHMKLCTEVGMTDAFCKANKAIIKTCKDQILSASHTRPTIQAAADCLHTVGDITVPDDDTATTFLFKQYMKTVVTIQDLCSDAEEMIACLKQNTEMVQLMKDCIAKAGK